MISSTKSSECVKVIVRCRPMSEKEYGDGFERIVNIVQQQGLVELKNPKSIAELPKSFTFDSVYDWNSSQRDLYDETFQSLVESVLNGFNGTIFAYGQTGTGKTYTMEGIRNDPEKRGVIPNSFEHIFDHIARSQNQQYLVRASYLEIYQEDIKDLLGKDRSKVLELKERPDIGVYVKDLSSFVTKSVKEIENVMNVGNQNRSVGATNMNEYSSRSHAIFIITIECSEIGIDNEAHIRVGHLNLVDLAGSERQSKTGATGDRFKEATKINLSLSALGNVISALVDGKNSHVPYRDSKLTRLLQDSLGGNAKTVMVANIGPASYNYEETLSTLRYANRAKNIKNKPRINEDPKDALLREFQEQIQRLKAALAVRTGRSGRKKRSKKKHVDSNGVYVDDDQSEANGEDDSSNVDEEEYIQEQHSKLQQERQSILDNRNMIEEEKKKLIFEIERRAEQLKKEEDDRKLIVSRITAMESKLLSGGGNIADHTRQQEEALAQKRLELAEQRIREREMLQMLESQEESAQEIQQTFSSLQQEVEIKTKKLKKLYMKLQQVTKEIYDLQNEHSIKRQERENVIFELNKELKLKTLIVENFVPNDVMSRLLSRVVFDEDEDTWNLQPSSPSSINPCATSSSDSTPFENPLRAGNVYLLSLDFTPRSLLDYVQPQVSPALQAAIDKNLKGDLSEEIVIDANSFKTKSTLKSRPRSAARSAAKSKSSMTNLNPEDRSLSPSKPVTNKSDITVYPKVRGLVGK